MVKNFGAALKGWYGIFPPRYDIPHTFDQGIFPKRIVDIGS
jgi:hypothetical protein